PRTWACRRVRQCVAERQAGPAALPCARVGKGRNGSPVGPTGLQHPAMDPPALEAKNYSGHRLKTTPAGTTSRRNWSQKALLQIVVIGLLSQRRSDAALNTIRYQT